MTTFMDALLRDSKQRTKEKRLALARQNKLVAEVEQACEQKKQLLLEEEERRMAKLPLGKRKMEEEAAQEVQGAKRAKTHVAASMEAQSGTSRAVMLVPAAAPGSKVENLSTAKRRSSRFRPVVSMDADTVDRLNKKSIQESKNAASKRTKRAHAQSSSASVKRGGKSKPAAKKQKK